MTFILTYVNSYMEVSGIRSLGFALQQEMNQPDSAVIQTNNMVASSTENIEATQIELQTLRQLETQGNESKDVRVKYIFSETATPSNSEIALIDEIYDHFLLDLFTWRNKNIANTTKNETDFEEALRAMFL